MSHNQKNEAPNKPRPIKKHKTPKKAVDNNAEHTNQHPLPKKAKIFAAVFAVIQIFIGLFLCLSAFTSTEASLQSYDTSIEEKHDELFAIEEDAEETQEIIDATRAILSYIWILILIDGAVIIISNSLLLKWVVNDSILMNKKRAIACCILALAFEPVYSYPFAITNLIIIIKNTKQKSSISYANAKSLKDATTYVNPFRSEK